VFGGKFSARECYLKAVKALVQLTEY